MPTFEITSPDGAVYHVNAPEGASQDQALAMVQQQHPQTPATGNAGGPKQAALNGFDSMVPFGNRITSSAAALGAYPIAKLEGLTDENGKSLGIGDLYNQAQADTKATASAHPFASAAGDAAGFVATLPLAGPVTKAIGTGLNAIPKVGEAGATLSNIIRGGKTAEDAAPLANVAIRAGKNAIMAAPLGAAYGAGNGEEGNRLHSAATGALLAGGGGAALSVAGDALAGKLSSPILTSDQIKKQAGMAYDTANYLGGVLKPEATNKFIDQVTALAPQTTKGQAMAGDTLLTKATNVIKGFKDTQFTLPEAQEVDEHLSNMIDGTIDRLTGRPSKEGLQIMKVQDALRDTIMNADQSHIEGGQDGFNALQQGRDLWSKAAKLRDVEKIISRAEMTDNPATSIKTGFRTLYSNPSRMRGFTPEEADAIQRASTTGFVTDTLRTMGSRLIPIAAMKSGPAATMVANAGSTLSRTAATNVQLGRAANVARMIGQDSKFIAPDIPAPPLTSQEAGRVPMKDLMNMPTEEAVKYLNALKGKR